jgi:signal peptidase II
MKRFLGWFFAPFAVMLILDQAVKAWARDAGQMMEGRVLAVVIPDVFELKLVFNHGIAFGFLQGQGWMLSPIALIMAGAAAYMALKDRGQPRINHLTLGLLASGAIGNLIDRVWMQKVTDMFYVRAINFPVFNIADACISVAAVLIVLGTFRKEPKKSPPSEAPADDGA